MSENNVTPITNAPNSPSVPARATSVVELDRIQYDVIAGPGPDTPLVKVARATVLQTLEVDKIIQNLYRTDDLLHVAACGVAGFINPQTNKSLSAQVMELQYKLRKGTGEMGSTLLAFGECAKNVLPILKSAFRDVYDLNEADALARLARCGDVATQMAATAEKLTGTFDGLATEANGIAQDTTYTRDLHEKARAAADQRRLEIEALEAEMKEKRDKLAEQLPKVTAWYEEAKAAQATADGRMFTLAIVGSVTKALGSALTAAVQFKAAPALAGAQLANALAEKTVSPPEKKTESDSKDAKGAAVVTAQAAHRVAKETLERAEAEYEKAKKKTTEAEKARDALQDPYDEAESAYKEARKKKAKDEGEKKQAFEKLKKPYETADKALDDAREAEQKAQTAYNEAKDAEAKAKEKMDAEASASRAGAAAAGLGAGLQSAGASAEDAAGAYAGIAANYAKEKAKYLELLMDLQKQEREALGQMAKFAKEIETQRGNVKLEQAAVESLHVAAGVLKIVAASLQDCKQFWDQMALACRRLQGSDIRMDIELHMKKTAAERIKLYSALDYQLSLLAIAAQWQAIRIVTDEARQATMKVYEKLGETYKKNPSIEEARSQAAALAQKLGVSIAGDIAQLDEKAKDIKVAQAETTKILAAAA